MELMDMNPSERNSVPPDFWPYGTDIETRYRYKTRYKIFPTFFETDMRDLSDRVIYELPNEGFHREEVYESIEIWLLQHEIGLLAYIGAIKAPDKEKEREREFCEKLFHQRSEFLQRGFTFRHRVGSTIADQRKTPKLPPEYEVVVETGPRGYLAIALMRGNEPCKLNVRGRYVPFEISRNAEISLRIAGKFPHVLGEIQDWFDSRINSPLKLTTGEKAPDLYSDPQRVHNLMSPGNEPEPDPDKVPGRTPRPPPDFEDPYKFWVPPYVFQNGNYLRGALDWRSLAPDDPRREIKEGKRPKQGPVDWKNSHGGSTMVKTPPRERSPEREPDPDPKWDPFIEKSSLGPDPKLLPRPTTSLIQAGKLGPHQGVPEKIIPHKVFSGKRPLDPGEKPWVPPDSPGRAPPGHDPKTLGSSDPRGRPKVN
jgi:hypothetical protein